MLKLRGFRRGLRTYYNRSTRETRGIDRAPRDLIPGLRRLVEPFDASERGAVAAAELLRLEEGVLAGSGFEGFEHLALQF